MAGDSGSGLPCAGVGVGGGHGGSGVLGVGLETIAGTKPVCRRYPVPILELISCSRIGMMQWCDFLASVTHTWACEVTSMGQDT